MTEAEYTDIKKGLQNSTSVSGLNDICRDILSKRLQWEKQPDRELRFLLDGIVKTLSFPINISCQEQPHLVKNSSKMGINALWFIAIAIGFVMTLSNYVMIRVVGILISILGTFIFSKNIFNSVSDSGLTSNNILVVATTTPEEIGMQIDSVYDALSEFYNYRQLEGRQVKILKWFQHLYTEDNSETLQNSISKLLSQFGYRFVDYTPERSADFELNPGNVDKPKTTQPALINEQGIAICRGTAVLPTL